MNFLDLINNVLRRMREDVVTGVHDNRLSSLVSDYVNDAKRQVEDSHDWSALHTDLTISTTADVSEYSLTGSSNRATIIDVRDTTNNQMMTLVPSAYIRKQELVDSPGTTQPNYYALEGTDSVGDSKIKFWPTPDGAYTIKVHCVLREGDLVAEGDTTSVPHNPIIMLAHAFAAAERGDVANMDFSLLVEKANRALSREIMLDAAKNPYQMIWTPE